MNALLRDIIDEVKQFLSGKTINALFPPIVYNVGNNLFELKEGIVLAISIAVILAIYRVIKKQSVIYALAGILGVVLASSLAYFSDNAANYFLPKIVSSGFLFIVSLISFVIGKPLAAILSHLGRGWEFEWFLRKDIKPAYREVTIVWSILFAFRMILQWTLFQRGNLSELGWANILLGFPAIFTVLILTLLYGTWRLKNLDGPGIDEWKRGTVERSKKGILISKLIGVRI